MSSQKPLDKCIMVKTKKLNRFNVNTGIYIHFGGKLSLIQKTEKPGETYCNARPQYQLPGWNNHRP